MAITSAYLIPHIGDIPLQHLRTSHIQAMFTALDTRNEEIRAGRASEDPAVRKKFRGVRPLQAASMRRLFGTLRVALNDAVRRAKLIPANPALGVELEAGTRPKARVWTPKAIEWWQASGERPSPVMVWRPEQAGQFLDYAQRHDAVLYPLFALILHRALRRGEACGLRDHDIDLGEAYLTVVQQITTVGYVPVVKKVKSDAGDRIIPLGPTTVAILNEYLEMRRGWQEASGDAWPNTGLFFVRPDGQPWHPQTVSDRFDNLIAASGLPPVRLHDLRHCAATYLRHGGADMKEIQEVLGTPRSVLPRTPTPRSSWNSAGRTRTLPPSSFPGKLFDSERNKSALVTDLFTRPDPAAGSNFPPSAFVGELERR